MIEQLTEIIKQNPLLTTVYSGGIVAVIVANFRNIVHFLKDRILYLISFTVLKVSNIGSYYEEDKNDLETFLRQQKHIFQKSYELTNSNNIREGFGISWNIIFGKLVCVTKELDASKNTLVLRINMRVFFANKEKFMKKLTESLESATEIYENKINISFDWNTRKREKRFLSSIYTNDNIKENLFNDIQSFISSKDTYIKYNILYKRNYLLYGKPGTGKSSLIFALASELNYKIKIIDLKSVSSVSDILYKIADTNKTFYVFEDIDALSTSFVERGEIDTTLVKQDDVKPASESPRSLDDSKEKGLNLSDILYVLDGLYTPEGIICFFTTNHIEKLDSAFLRDGRMDYKIELGDLNKEVANQMIKDKLGYENLFEQEFINPATLQELIIQVAWGKLTIDEFKEKINKIFEK